MILDAQLVSEDGDRVAEPTRTFFRNKVIEDRLGAYVYALIDPRGPNVFYIGKAGGRDGEGNTRPDAHLEGAANAQASGAPMTRKQQIIASLWADGLEPTLAIVRRIPSAPLSASSVAFEVEAALIDVLRLFFHAAEGNEDAGQHIARGLLIGSEIEHEVTAAAVNPRAQIEDVWLFNISHALGGVRNPTMAELYKAVRGDWAIGLPPRAGIAVGLVSGISRVVCRVGQWYAEEEASGRRRRKRFDGEPLNPDEPIAAELLHRDFSRIIAACPSWLRGQALRVDFDGCGAASPTYNGRRDVPIILS
jgi:hypothetical protein